MRRGLWRLALPMVLSGALHDAFTLADLYFVSRLEGDAPVAALTVCGNILAFVILMAMGIGTGTTALVAHFVGKEDYENADVATVQTLVLGVLASIPVLVIGLMGSGAVLSLFSLEPPVVEAATGYLRISFACSVFMFVSVGLCQALYGAGDAVTPFRALLVTNVINIALDPLLIFGWGPFPAMGINGSAAATVASRALLALLLALHLLYGRSTIHLRRGAAKLNPRFMRRILYIGVFASGQVFMRQFSLILLTRLVAGFGTAALAAYGIANRLRFMVIGPGAGLSNVGAVMVGQNMGAGKPDRASKAGWETVKHYLAFAVPAAIGYIVFAPRLIGIFSNNADVIGIGSVYLRFLGVTFPFVATSVVLARAMSGAGDTFAPAVLTAIGQLLLRVPAAYLLALTLAMGPMGIWLGINASEVVQAVLMALYFHGGWWQNKYYRHREKLESRL